MAESFAGAANKMQGRIGPVNLQICMSQEFDVNPRDYITL